MPRLDTGFSSRSVVTAIFKHELFGSRCATSQCSMAKVGDGCSDPRTVSGTAENASGGCRRTLPAASTASELSTSPLGRWELLERMSLSPPDAAGQCGCQRHQRGEQPQPPPYRPLLSAQQLVLAETAVAVERAGDAPTVAALVQLQAAMPTAHLIGMVQHHGRLVAARA